MSIRSVPDAMLRCRDLGHEWEDEIIPTRKVSFGQPRECRCVSCGTVRSEIVNYSGTVDTSTRRYEQTDAYHEACQWERADCRKERMRRARGKGQGRASHPAGGLRVVE